MNIEKYPYVSKRNHKTFLFKSVGPKGTIKKIASFRLINERYQNIYNLSFGDRDGPNFNKDYFYARNKKK